MTLDSSELSTCSPWDRWVLVALHRHVARQRFVEQIVRERLSGSPELIAKEGYSGHPEGMPGTGKVPGMPEWRYELHGIGCCLENQDGTVLDVDFDREHGSDTIDASFYEHFLKSTPTLGWLESRLRGTDGDWSGWKASIHPLHAAGLLDGDHRVHVTPDVRDWCEAVSQAADRAEGSDAQLCAVALAVEDYPLASKLDPSLAPGLQVVAKRQIDDRCRELEARLSGRIGPHVESCLAALHSLDVERARGIALGELERDVVDGVTSASMILLAADPRPGDIPTIRALLARLRGIEVVPAPFLRIRGVSHLLAPYRRATVPEHVRAWVLEALAEDQGASEADAALLVYMVDGERGRARLERGLNSTIPITREHCAAGLAVVVGESPASMFGKWFGREYEPRLRDWEANG
jgi:hypothetical protein